MVPHRQGLRLVLCVLALAALALSADRPLTHAQGPERRVALLIGNSAYRAEPLNNPVNDVRATNPINVRTTNRNNNTPDNRNNNIGIRCASESRSWPRCRASTEDGYAGS